MATREARFEELFARTRSALMGYAVRRVGDPADDADVVAETYLVAWRRLDEVPPGEETRLWLFGVARRVLANHQRGERRRLAAGLRVEGVDLQRFSVTGHVPGGRANVHPDLKEA
jgi:RNA polymerase sigma-70 factor (ECF subfamily)